MDTRELPIQYVNSYYWPQTWYVPPGYPTVPNGYPPPGGYPQQQSLNPVPSRGSSLDDDSPRLNIPPVTPYPPDPYINQFPYAEALVKGTLFRWLHHSYEEPKRE